MATRAPRPSQKARCRGTLRKEVLRPTPDRCLFDVRAVPAVLASFRFDGRDVPFQAGDTLASALHRAGVKVLSRSMKYHRPRGLYCVTGSCASCFVQVDGVPNVPACTRPAQDGCEVASQNRIGSARRDLLQVVDLAFPQGFDPHSAFTFPGPVNRLFVRSVRQMSGWGKAPQPGTGTATGNSTTLAPSGRRRTRQVDEVIVGGGRHGLQRALEAAGQGRDILLVEENDTLGGSACWDPSESDTLALATQVRAAAGVEVWTGALAFGWYDGVLAVRRGDDLWELTAKRMTFAPGHHDAVPVFPDNDRPGILSVRGARRLWYGHGVLPGTRMVGHGDPLPKDLVRDLSAAGCELVAEGEVTGIHGRNWVERVNVGGSFVTADVVVCNLPGVPRLELFQQAGCRIGWNGSGPAPILGTDGATGVAGVIGTLGPSAAPATAPPFAPSAAPASPHASAASASPHASAAAASPPVSAPASAPASLPTPPPPEVSP